MTTLSPTGFALVQDFEGFSAEPVHLRDGAWLVGHGHVRVGEAGAPVSRAEAAELLARDLAPVARMVNDAVTQTLRQSQFDALVSFAFSIGAAQFLESQVLRRINAGEFIAAACAMDAWRKSDASGELEIIGALVARRAAEKALFLRDLPLSPAPSALLRAKLDHAASILGAPVGYACAPPALAAANVEPATSVLLLTQIAPLEAAENPAARAKPTARRVRSRLAHLVDRGALLALMAALGLRCAPKPAPFEN